MAKLIDLSYCAIQSRIKRGWSKEKAIRTPVRGTNQ